MVFAATLYLTLFAAFAVLLYRLRKRGWSLAWQILAGLVLGLLFGSLLQAFAPDDTAAATLQWTNVIGSAYVNLLMMIVMPLVLVMMVAAVLQTGDVKSLGRVGGSVIVVLVTTTMIAALVGVLVANAFQLTAEGLTQGARELARATLLEERHAGMGALTIPEMLTRFVPSNIFYDLTGARPTSIVAVVLFGILLGLAALAVGRDSPARLRQIASFVETAQAVVMKLVHMVMALTPYGILALITKVVAGADAGDTMNLLSFLAASYVAIAIMFGVHAGLLALAGVSVVDYFKKAWPVLAFAFSSRSSAASIPLNVETQIESLGVRSAVANLSASLGATIGQNGCAGIYPAMLAVMIAPSMGIDPMSPGFVAGLVAIIAVSSFGVAGVGGGATVAALIVLPALGFPVVVAALLISIEPLIDMARTALNVNGAMTAGVLVNRFLGSKPAERPVTAPD